MQSAGLITLEFCLDGCCFDRDGPWAQIAWPDLDPALRDGTILGSSRALRVPAAAASIGDGHPVDLGDLAASLDRRLLTLVLAAIAHAAGSHEQRTLIRDPDGIPHPGEQLPPLVSWRKSDLR